MKYFILLMLCSGTVQAKAYKCEVNGKITYQQMPCANGGAEMQLNDDFNQADYNASTKRIDTHQQQMKEQKKAGSACDCGCRKEADTPGAHQRPDDLA